MPAATHSTRTLATGIHPIVAVTYPDAAGRVAHTGAVGVPWSTTALAALPVGLVARQLDDDTLYVLRDNDGVTLTWLQLGAGGGGGGAVDSVFGRTGAVTAQSGDYAAHYDALGAAAAAQTAAESTAAAALSTHAADSDAHGAATALAAHVAAADPHPGYTLESREGAANGVATLDGSTEVPLAQLGKVSAQGQETVRIPVSPGDTVQERIVLPYSCTLIGVTATPIGSSAVDSSSGDATASLVVGATQLLASATTSLDGGTLDTAAALSLTGTTANLDLAANAVAVLALTFPADTTPVPTAESVPGGYVVIQLRWRVR